MFYLVSTSQTVREIGGAASVFGWVGFIVGCGICGETNTIIKVLWFEEEGGKEAVTTYRATLRSGF